MRDPDATIFNIQRFCLHDGPGVRTTVFFKGCPLACAWCHNPESQSAAAELLFDADKCTCCGRCTAACGHGAADARAACVACGACVTACPAGARELAGRGYSLAQLMAEIEKERPFFEESGGGVTLSGGEPLLHIDSAERLAQTCKDRGIGVAVDTCGAVPYDSFRRMLSVTDVFLYDLKAADSGRHIEYTGSDNALILENLRRLSDDGARIWLRLPLIEGINADAAAIEGVLNIVAGLNIEQAHLLPYHDIGRGKYKRLGRAYDGRNMQPVAADRLAEIRSMLERQGLRVVTGG